MELSALSYYDQNRFYNTYYLILISLLQYFCREVFKNDGTRMIYASPDFAFRQRLNQLNANTNPDFSSLQLPFGNLYRNGNWEKDTKVGVVNAGAAWNGVLNDNASGSTVRFMNVQAPFDLMFYFDRESDAQIAYETLLWIKHPSQKLLTLEGIEYKGRSISIPLALELLDISYSPNFGDIDFLKQQKMIPIVARLQVHSVIFDQYAQGATSSLFSPWPGGSGLQPVVLTEKVVLDFLTYHGSNDFVDRTGILLEVASTVAPDPALNGSLTFNENQIDPETGEPVLDPETGLPIPATQDTAITVTWDYNRATGVDIPALYETNVRITCSNGTSYDVPLINRTYTITELEADSVYTISIFFISKKGEVTKYSVSGHTTYATTPPNLKGMIGLTW